MEACENALCFTRIKYYYLLTIFKNVFCDGTLQMNFVCLLATGEECNPKLFK